MSGQLNVETHACALSDVYTFGPTFRAENSHTARHLAEFWMIEPEICFAELKDDMALAVLYLLLINTCITGLYMSSNTCIIIGVYVHNCRSIHYLSINTCIIILTNYY